MEEIVKSYIAGLIDGEGSILLTKKNKWRYPAVSISSTTIEMLNFLIPLYGGCISQKRHLNKNYLTEYQYSVVYDKAILLLKDILPYLKHPIKKQRAELIINDYKKVTKRNGKYNSEEIKRKEEFENKFFSY